MSNKESRKIDPSIIAALIGGVVTIVVTVLTINANKPAPPPPTETPIPIPIWTIAPTATITDTPVPTTTVEVGEPTSTPAPDTETPVPSATPEPPSIGEDWANGCISALWKVVPVGVQLEQENGCWKQPVGGDFSITDNGRVSFLVNRSFDSGDIYGMFAPLSAEGTVGLKTHLDIVENGEVWIGVFAAPSTDSAGVVMYIPAGEVTERPLVKLTLPEKSTNKSKPYARGDATYDVKFTYTIGTVAVSSMNGSFVFNAIPVASNQKWLFVGYRAANGNNAIGASFFDLAFK